MNWENLRPDQMPEAIERSGGLCILPLGCTEKHGAHLPLGTDSFEVRHHAEQAAALEEAVIFPVAPWLGDMVDISPCDYKEKNHGCIALSPHTLLTVLEELCDEIARNGFRKILLLNCHGGNKSFLGYFLRCQAYNQKPYATMTGQCWDETISRAPIALEYFTAHRAESPMLTDADMELLKKYADHPEGFGRGGHGGFMETAWMLGAHPELVATERMLLEDGRSTHRVDYLTEVGVEITSGWQANYPNALGGHLTFGCSPTVGEAFNLYSARKVAKMIKAIKNDEDCVRIATGK